MGEAIDRLKDSADNQVVALSAIERVKGYFRTSKNGKRVHVGGYTRTGSPVSSHTPARLFGLPEGDDALATITGIEAMYRMSGREVSAHEHEEILTKALGRQPTSSELSGSIERLTRKGLLVPDERRFRG
jgi:hypothetical protein